MQGQSKMGRHWADVQAHSATDGLVPHLAPKSTRITAALAQYHMWVAHVCQANFRWF